MQLEERLGFNLVNISVILKVVCAGRRYLQKLKVAEFPNRSAHVDEDGVLEEPDRVDGHVFIEFIRLLVVPHQHYFVEPVGEKVIQRQDKVHQRHSCAIS